MKWMFGYCSSLKELNINFNSINNAVNMKNMFSGCSDELIIKIRNKNINEEAFDI